MRYTYYHYNHQLFRINEDTNGIEQYHDKKKQWIGCMVFQITNLLSAIKKGRVGEVSEEKLFEELL